MKAVESNKRNSWIATTLLAITAIVVALFIGELMVRVFLPQTMRFNVTQWDEYVGFTNIPNIEGFTKHTDFEMKVTINSKGLRDKEYPYEKPEHTIRIGVFGDSFTFGEGVQNNETYPKRLEDKFAANKTIQQMGWAVEVINFGIGKTGTSHQYALYKKEGRKYNLDYVVLGFLASNDFSDNQAGVFNLNGNELIHNPAAYSNIRRIQKIVYSVPFYHWLAGNSHLVNFLRLVATHADDRARTSRHKERAPTKITTVATDGEQYHLTWVLLEAFYDAVQEDGAEMLLMTLPIKHQKQLVNYSSEALPPSIVVMQDKLMRDASAKGMAVFDLVPVFAPLPVKKYYFQHDGHMNAAGNRMLASELFSYLSPSVLELIQRNGISDISHNSELSDNVIHK